MKRIVLCLDGTWNNSRAGSILTNVCKLHQVIAPADGNGVQQISHYVEGIVSAEGESLQFVKGGVGVGVDDRIEKAYELLVKDYEPGDEIFLVGFSRGAFEARSLGGLITLIGVAKPGFSLDRAWSMYRTREKARNQGALAELRAAAHYPVRIKCVAVWDTVGNLGNPFVSGGAIGRRYEFHDTCLTDNIDVGLHALSIDEIRGPFRPTLWTLPKAQALPANQHVEQVWFAGTHADVGGGHRETGLSDIALLWMAERLQANTALALDMHKLGHMTRPDALGPQHSVAEGWIFKWSGWLPFIRLVEQAIAAIPPLRRALIGSWRSGKLPRHVESVNESIHPSVLERFGKRVIELHYGRSHAVSYEPRNLAAALPEARAAEATKPDSGRLRRVKVFTVHGTFAHDATWDDWDRADEANKDRRAFINWLAALLKERGITLEQLDHTQYNWSGGNSHDERRVAAIGLKKLMQEELSKAYQSHGRDYYDKVFIIGHSHGGTISRLAMNLWDKDDDYYDPVRNAQIDELKHDDECPTCLRIRNGPVGRNSVRRPDGVITLGSPFVSFEPRSGGVLTARLSAWVFRILMAVPFAILIWASTTWPEIGAFGVVSTLWKVTPSFLKTILLLIWPLALYWMAASYLPQQLDPIERWLGTNKVAVALRAAAQTVKYVVLVGLIIYYLAYVTGGYSRMLDWLPWSSPWFKSSVGWAHLFTVTFFVLVAVPGSFLAWLRRDVVGLRGKLPIKYDPAEDRLVSYVSYLTPGDEAGVHLRVFGVLTWAVQTLALSAASVLTFGIILTVIVCVEALLGLSQRGSLLNQLGISAVSDFPEYRDRFIALIDALTYLPKLVWTDIMGASWLPSLGNLDNSRATAWFIPMALVASILIIFLFLMPFVVLAIAGAYLASMWLRSSGVVFGSEKLSWNLANRITVMRHANQNTALRVMFIAPQAWWRREIAHSYYYKSGRVIRDVADRIADWSNHRATPAWPVEAWLGSAARIFVVLLFVLSIFAVSVPVAIALSKVGTAIAAVLESVTHREIDLAAPGSLPEPKDASGYNQRADAFQTRKYFDRAIADHNKAIAIDPNYATAYNDRGNAHAFLKRDYDLAIADYSKAIELEPSKSLFVDNRGRAYRNKGDYDRAIADHSKAIELAPDNAAAYHNRGVANYLKRDNNAAIADYTKAAELAPSNAEYILARAIAKYRAGDFNGAAQDLSPRSTGGSSRSAPAVADPAATNLYAVLFRYLARTRGGESAAADLEAAAATFKSKDWPYAVAELYLGKRSPDATLAAARTSAERCEGQFYIGQWHLLNNNAAEATNAFKAMVDACDKTDYEYGIALDELERLSR